MASVVRAIRELSLEGSFLKTWETKVLKLRIKGSLGLSHATHKPESYEINFGNKTYIL